LTFRFTGSKLKMHKLDNVYITDQLDIFFSYPVYNNRSKYYVTKMLKSMRRTIGILIRKNFEMKMQNNKITKIQFVYKI
jgi:hypothetical protein